jgi:hypothetical protein
LNIKLRSSAQNIRDCYEILIEKLNQDHSEIRYSALQIVDCLFMRSHLFRELVLDEFHNLFELVLGKLTYIFILQLTVSVLI